MNNIISAENLMFYYSEPVDEENTESIDENKILVFEQLDMKIQKGSFTVILGHNGCGKSTLAKHMNAILLPCGGKMYAAEYDTSDETHLFDIRKHIGMVFQNPDNQIVASVVEEDVAFALENMVFLRKKCVSVLMRLLKLSVCMNTGSICRHSCQAVRNREWLLQE